MTTYDSFVCVVTSQLSSIASFDALVSAKRTLHVLELSVCMQGARSDA